MSPTFLQARQSPNISYTIPPYPAVFAVLLQADKSGWIPAMRTRGEGVDGMDIENTATVRLFASAAGAIQRYERDHLANDQKEILSPAFAITEIYIRHV